MAAAAPVLVNGILVAVLLALRASEAPAERLGLWLSASVSVQGVAQLVVLMIAMRQMPTPPRLVRPRWSPEIEPWPGSAGLLAVAGPLGHRRGRSVRTPAIALGIPPGGCIVQWYLCR